MNIIIPINGKGLRFAKSGFHSPKPLINVLGKPMVLRVMESLDINDDDCIIIIYSKDLEDYSFEYIIKNNFSNFNIKFVKLNYDTRGAAETVLSGINAVYDQINLDTQTVVADVDTIYEDNVLHIYRNDLGNRVFYFIDDGQRDIFSYILFNDNKNLTSIKEKNRISNNACTGLYCFESGKLLKSYCQKIINKNENSHNGEFYISGIFEEMIKDGLVVKPIKIDNFNCVGTPSQLKSYCIKNKDKSEKLRFCFDLDNTLVTYPKTPLDYSTVDPIYDSINYLKFLKDCGHSIIINTARRMKTHNGNKGKVLADIGEITINTLNKFEIPYDELYFGKPYANFYIDDLSVNPKVDIDKKLGFYSTKIKERHFNKVILKEKSVLKKGHVVGEVFWYRNIPESISDLFPKLISSGDDFIEIEKIDGITFSHMLINCSITEDDIDNIIKSLSRIHEAAESGVSVNSKLNIYENYFNKIKIRLDNNKSYYSKLDPKFEIFNKIKRFVLSYEKNNMAFSSIIHGDPVFTNIISTPDKGVYFIDMRGLVGGYPTMVGDSFYDYCKVYQSLCGYDHIIHESEDMYDSYHLKLKEYYEKFIKDKFGFEFLTYLKAITSSLYYSMIPLHSNEENKIKFFEVSKQLLSELK